MTGLVAAVLAAFALHPAVCQPSWDAYDQAAGLPQGTVWWAGVGGYYNWRTGELGLTQQTCVDLVKLRTDGYTWQRGYAAFTLAHELGHASGIYDETAADCYGAGHAAAIAYAFGLRDRASFLRLRQDGLRLWGYQPIPAACFIASG